MWLANPFSPLLSSIPTSHTFIYVQLSPLPLFSPSRPFQPTDKKWQRTAWKKFAYRNWSRRPKHFINTFCVRASVCTVASEWRREPAERGVQCFCVWGYRLGHICHATASIPATHMAGERAYNLNDTDFNLFILFIWNGIFFCTPAVRREFDDMYFRFVLGLLQKSITIRRGQQIHSK